MVVGGSSGRDQLRYTASTGVEAGFWWGELLTDVLTWRGRLDVSSDAQTFFYKYTRTLLRDGVVIRTKTWEEPIPRDHQ
jgi:hypothetical protein